MRRRKPSLWRNANRSRRKVVAVLIAMAGTGIAVYFFPQASEQLALISGTRSDCRVIRVKDGDTVQMACPGIGKFDARLLGFDSPEKFDPRCEKELLAANSSQAFLAKILRDAGAFTQQTKPSDFQVVLRGEDHYGRTLVHTWANGTSVARSMVENGHGYRFSGLTGVLSCFGG